MLVTAIRIAEPSAVLFVGTPSPSGLAPLVHLEPLGSFWRAIGRQSGFNRLLNGGAITCADSLRYDRTARRVLAFERDCIDRRLLVVNAAVPFGLLMSNGGTDDLEGDMRRLFESRSDARTAAADVLRMCEQAQAAIG
ncbi:hypothetical protein [Erythrobacter sp.]|uniref:hypothetical protein n=1 Tax=Erythrobacter sp. TaxID=1042 RepID=UPI0025DF2258|nr:hypothetical protein [Erythrobacter sp.]